MCSAAAFDHTEYDLIVMGFRCGAFLWAGVEIGFIHFDRTSQVVTVCCHELTDAVEHAPRGLVGDTEFPLQLLGADTGPGLCYEVDGIEPALEFSARMIKDGAFERVDMMAAETAGVGRPARDVVESVLLRAARTGQYVAEAPLLYLFQTGIIIREPFVELLYRELLFHIYNVVERLLVVKG